MTGQAAGDSSLPASVPIPDLSDPSLADWREEQVLNLRMSWNSKTFELRVPDQDRVYDLKNLIWSLTEVPPERIKLLGLSSLKIPLEDSQTLAELKIKKGGKFVMIGTSEENSFKDPSRLQQKEVIDDFDVDYSEQKVAPHDEPRNKRKVKEKSASLSIDIINPPRPGKKLLVLDLDYTIVDTKPLVDGSLPANECARPGLHEFLRTVYEHYDLCVWSQTSWRWLESKLTELGMLGEELERGYKVSFVVDRRPMFKIFTKRKENGVEKDYSHEVKALEILWSKFPQFSAANTVHIDDLGRNFAMNPREGLKIKAFKGAGTSKARSDKELPRLADYLTRLASLGSFQEVDHATDWPKFRKRSHRS